MHRDRSATSAARWWPLVAVAVVGVGLWLALGQPDRIAPADPAVPVSESSLPAAAAAVHAPRAEPEEAARRVVAADPDDVGTPTSGEITLRIGECYSFGVGLRPRAEREAADVYCLDITAWGCSLRCPSGAGPALKPMTAIGLPETAVAAARTLVDAPRDLGAFDLDLLARPRADAAGVGFARTRSRATLALWIVEVGFDPDAIERQVRIGFRAVPAVDGGGSLRLPTAAGAPSAEILAAILAAREIGGVVPGDTFAQYLEGAYQVASDLGAETVLSDGGHLAVGSLAHEKVELARQGAIFAGRLGRDASIVLREGGAAGVVDDLEGLLRTDGYAYLYVGRDLLGTLDIRSYTTAVVLGDLRGTIRMRSYTTLYVRGRILGTIDCARAGWCTFYFQAPLMRADLERMQGEHRVTVHLRTSDLAPGRHERVGRWREVIVGDPLWQKLAR